MNASSKDVVCMDHRTVLTTEQYQVMVHALGLTRRGGRGRFGRRWAYRNYFEAGVKDVDLWRDLEKKGLARQVYPISTLHGPVFEVTRAGMAAMDVLRYIPQAMLLGDSPCQ